MNNYSKGLVSVIIPTYKRSDKLARAIESVLSQTYSDLELLLINDNEPDDEYSKELPEVISKFTKDSRFHFLNQPKHINGAVARNYGISHAKGEYIAFLDDDDWWQPNKLALQIKAFSKLPNEFGIVSCKIERYNNDHLIAKLPRYDSGYVCKDILMLKSDFATGTLMIKHCILDELGAFDEKLIRHQDLQLLVNLTYKYKLYQVNEYLHCCDVSDAQNRPNVEKIKKAKKAFFSSIAPIFLTLTEKEQRAVKLVHLFEVGYVEIKNRHIIGIVHMGKVVLSYSAFCTVIKKIKMKYESKRLVTK